MLLCNTVGDVLENFVNANKRIKEIQIGDHEIKIVNFTDNTTISLRYIAYLNRVQVISRLYENPKIN